MQKLLISIIASLVLLTSDCLAAEVDYSELNWYPDAYNPAGFFVCPAYNLALAAPPTYFKVYGHWPASWQAIVDSGLIQVPICVKRDTPITPDDGVYDNEWDILYFDNNGMTPGIGLPPHVQGNITWLSPMNSGHAYEHRIQAILDSNAGFDPMILQCAEVAKANQEFQRLLGICDLCHEGLKMFRSSHARNPQSWQEYMESGFAPISSSSINPVTGGLIYGDGRANDIHFETADEGHLAMIYPTGADGKRAWWGSL